MANWSSIWLKTGEWFLNRRWWVVGLASLAVFIFESIEYQPFLRGINQYFLFEILFYGVFMPALTGLALTWLAASRKELAWTSYFLNLQNNLHMQLNNADSLSELADLLLQFFRAVMPLVGFRLYVYNQPVRNYDTILTWTMMHGSNNTRRSFQCNTEDCGLLTSKSVEAVPLASCSDKTIAPVLQESTCICIPFVVTDTTVAGAHLSFPHESIPSNEQTRLLQEISPDITSAFERVRLLKLMKSQNRNIRVEQRRIARDVHDSLGHSLAFLGLKLDQITMDIHQSELDNLRHEVEGLRDIAKEAYDQMRDVLVMLSPENGSNLHAAVQNYIEKIRDRTHFEIHLWHHGQPYPLPSLILRNIFFILQESLANVEKHARAKQAVIDLSWKETELEILIKDDGVGFDTIRPPLEGHFGLANMRDRANEIGALLDISSQEGRGTRIMLRIPYRPVP